MVKGTQGSRCYTHSSSRCRCDNTIFMLFSGLGELQFFRWDLLLLSTCAMCCKDTTINEWQQEISFTKIKRQVSQRGKSPTWFWLWLLFLFFFFFFGKVAASCCLHISHFSSFHCFAAWSMMIRSIHTYITYIFMHIMIIISLRVVFVFCVSGTRRRISFAWPPLKRALSANFKSQCELWTVKATLQQIGLHPNGVTFLEECMIKVYLVISCIRCTLHIGKLKISKLWTLFDWFILFYSKSCLRCCCCRGMYSCIRAKATQLTQGARTKHWQITGKAK